MKKRSNLKLDDVRLADDGCDVIAAPLAYFDLFETYYARGACRHRITVRSTADWSAIVRHINRNRTQAHQRDLAEHHRVVDAWAQLTEAEQLQQRAWFANNAPTVVVPADRPPPEPPEMFTRPSVEAFAVESRHPGSGVFTCHTCVETAVQPRAWGRLPRYCSPACEPKPVSRAKPRPTIKCAVCGESFSPRRRDARTCSTRCRVAAHRAAA
jgi:formylmethanofuran dehydrogenase subunit E